MSSRPKSRASRRYAVEDHGMRALEIAEDIAAHTLDDARKGYDALYERVYRFAALLASGAGAAAVYAFGKIGHPGALTEIVPIAALSLWWFAIMVSLLARGGASRALKAGTGGDAFRARYLQRLQEHGSEEDAVWLSRWDQVKAVDLQAEDYAKGTTARARSLDRAVWFLAGSPVIAGFACLGVLAR